MRWCRDYWAGRPRLPARAWRDRDARARMNRRLGFLFWHDLCGKPLSFRLFAPAVLREDVADWFDALLWKSRFA
jgi:hypothetical protein